MANEKGFTLIELMIVVAIIGTLALIAMPMYKDYVRTAADNACLAEARGFAGAQVISLSQGDKMEGVDWSACSEPTGEVPEGETLEASAYVPIDGFTLAAPNFIIQSTKPGHYKIQCAQSGGCTLVNTEGKEQYWAKPTEADTI